MDLKHGFLAGWLCTAGPQTLGQWQGLAAASCTTEETKTLRLVLGPYPVCQQGTTRLLLASLRGSGVPDAKC